MHCIESFIFKWHIFSGSYRPHWDCKGLHRPKKLLSCTENLLWIDLSVCEDTFFRKTSNKQPVWPSGMVKSTSLLADDFFWNLAWVAQKLKVKQEMLQDLWTCFSCLFFPWWISKKICTWDAYPTTLPERATVVLFPSRNWILIAVLMKEEYKLSS